MAEDRVTFLVANHGYGRWLPGCLGGAARTLHRPCRCVVVDDGSPDDSVAAVAGNLRAPRPFAAGGAEGVEGLWRDTDFPVRLVAASPPRGPAAARNVAAAADGGWADWYQILDADDEAYPHKVTRLLECARAGGDRVGAAYADYDVLGEDGVVVREYKRPFSHRELLRDCVVHSGALVSGKALRGVGFFDEGLRVCEDYDLWLRLAEAGWDVVHVPESLSLVRAGGHNSTATVAGDRWAADRGRVLARAAAGGNAAALLRPH